jgi:tetratricopeptide (TPR) repeat protein
MLSVSGEEAWSSLRYHVEWAEGCALIVLFSSTPAVHDVLRERLEQIYRTRVSHLQQVTPCSAETLTAEIMSLIRTPSELYEHARVPLWLDPSISPHDTAWQKARDNPLARLNEHRELLRQRLHRPVIIVLPAGYRPRLREGAPDLWSIRDFSLELDEHTLVRQEEEISGVLQPAERRQEVSSPSSSQATTFFDEAQLQEWERLKQRGAKSRERLLAGWRATDAALSARQLQRAAQLAAEALSLSRELAAIGENNNVPETLRDVSVSLNNVGNVARALGRWEDADAAYRESLALRRQLRERLGDLPETLRDVSVSLDNVGDVAHALGRWGEAEQLYRESLILWRRLDLAFPDTAEYQNAIEALTQKLAAVESSASQAPTEDVPNAD